jgi:Cyclin, N-terminal domain/Cyclin, C-terminal domain
MYGARLTRPTICRFFSPTFHFDQSLTRISNLARVKQRELIQAKNKHCLHIHHLLLSQTTTVSKMIFLQQSDMIHFSTLQAMRRQETSGYAKRDFLHLRDDVDSDGGCSSIDIDVDCRDKMCDWSHQIVDFCKFSRESVEIAMSLLDRFLLTPAGTTALRDRTVYQLASMTCLYTAIKVHERQALNPSVVSQLSRGTYSAEQIEATEATILTALQWRVNPPTALSFVREFLSTMLPEMSEETASILALACAQTERAVAHYGFIAVPASTIAYGALLNALETSNVMHKDAIQYIGQVLAQVLDLDIKQAEAVLQFLAPVCRIAAMTHMPQLLAPSTAVTHIVDASMPEKFVHCSTDSFESPRGVSRA